MGIEIAALIFLATGVAVSAVIFALILLFYPHLVDRGPDVAGVSSQLERALLPILYHAIASAYRTAERAAYDGYRPLSATDKKNIADGVYDLLPSEIAGLDTDTVRQLISREQFDQMIQDAFNAFDCFYKENRVHFDQEYESWKMQRRLPVRRVK